MVSSIVIHPHSHLTQEYVQSCLKRVFPHTCRISQQGKGTYVWKGNTEQAELYMLELLKCWIPTHLTQLEIEADTELEIPAKPPLGTGLLRIPLHPSRAADLETTRDFGVLHLHRLVQPFPPSDADVFVDELHLHCQQLQTLWVATLEQIRSKNPEILIPKPKTWLFLQAVVGLRLNILLQKNPARFEPASRLLQSLENQLTHYSHS